MKGGWVRRLLSWLAPHKLNVVVAFGAALVGTGVAGLTPVVQKIVVDDVTRRTGAAVAPWLALLVAAGVARFALAYVRRFFGGRVAADVQYDLRTALFRHVQRLDVASHDQMQTGQLVARANTDVNALHHLLSLLPLVLGNLLLFVVALVVMVRLSPLLTLVVFAIVPLMAVTTVQVRRTIFPASWDASQRAGVVAGIVDESVSGVRVVKGFGQERRELERLSAAAADLLGSRIRLVRLQARFAPTLQVIPVLAQVAVLAVGGWLAIRDRISLGTFLAFNVYVTQLVGPVRMAAFLVAFGQQARASIERLSEVLDANPSVSDRPGASELGSAAGALELDDVTFGYVPSEPVLDHFSLRVEPGETVALVGTSGSGKSTVALLVPRFYDVHAGAVRIGGVDVRDVTLASLRSRIGVVFEDPFLFSDTVRANIAYGRPDATDDEVEVAARAAEAHEFISALPHGYATVVGEQGLTLSGGQRQRVALARALLTDPQVLILDDATSAVDSQVEQEILATLRRLLVGRTTVLVAHRRSTLRLADRIAVVDGGRVVALGTAEELEAGCPRYRALLSGPQGDLDEGAGLDHSPLDDAPPAEAAAPAWDGQPTAGLWPQRDVTVAEALAAAGRLPKPDPSEGPRAGGRGGGMRGVGHAGAPMVPTPELMAQVAALPPATDRPDVTVAELDVVEPTFSFWRFLRRWRPLLALSVGLVVLDSLTNLLGPTIVRYGVDRGVVPGRTGFLWVATALALLVALVSWANAVVEQLVTGSTAERVLYALRVRIFAHLQRLSLDYYDREMAGRVMTRMTTDVDALQQLLATGLVHAVVSGVTCGGVAIALVVMSPPLALVTSAIIPPLAIATWLYRQRAHRAYGLARERVAEVNADFQENLSGVRVTQAYSREHTNETRFEGLADGYRRARVDAQRLVALYFPFVEMLSELANALVLGAGAVLVGRGTTTSGELIAFLLYLNLFFAPIQQLSSVFDTWQQARISVKRIDELLATPSGTPVADDPIDPGRLAGRLELVDVHFRYGDADESLRGVSLAIDPGETVAFVGETGAGKSTVLKLVARFYDVTGGAVRADGIDVRRLDLTAYRRQLGVVPQEPYLFAGTIRDNIAYGCPEATDAEVEAAARAVGAHEVVARLPGGYGHVVGERGRSLSAGQRQLMALARALLPDPSILLLDEATANLDLASEARVAEGMGVASRGRTTLLIAHRLSSAAVADRIVVMDQGRIVEVGTHDDLLAREGRYAALRSAFAGTAAGATP